MKSPFYLNVNGKYGMGAYAQPDYPTLADLLASMDRLGIWQTVAYHLNARDLHPVFGNRFLLADIEKTPGARERIIPAFCANPAMLVGNGEMEALEECLAATGGCVIIFPKTNRFRMLEYKRVLDRIKKYEPVILVDAKEMTLNDVEDLANLAPEYPTLKFVVKEVMWWEFSRIFEIMQRTVNIYCDISWLHTRDSIKMLCEHVDYKRVLFGVGFRSHNAAAIGGLSMANIPQHEKDAIAWDNFTAILSPLGRKAVISNKKASPTK